MMAIAYTVILGSYSFFIASRQGKNMKKNFDILYNKMCTLDKKINAIKKEMEEKRGKE